MLWHSARGVVTSQLWRSLRLFHECFVCLLNNECQLQTTKPHIHCESKKKVGHHILSKKGAYNSSWYESRHRATGHHLPHGITQCYLPPDKWTRPGVVGSIMIFLSVQCNVQHWTEYKPTLASVRPSVRPSVRCPSRRQLRSTLWAQLTKLTVIDWAQFWTDLHQIWNTASP